jgi:hypothetical protein
VHTQSCDSVPLPLEITASIISPGLPVLGDSFFFTCQVDNLVSDANFSISYSLQRPTGDSPLTTVDASSLPNVTFDAITLADVGFYQCNVTISSEFLTNDIRILTNPSQIITFISE